MRLIQKVYKPLIVTVIIGIISAGIFFRVVHPQADPFSDRFIDTQDEGLHSYAARNYYLYHTWNTDSLSYGSMMPVYPRLQVLGVYLLGLHNYGFRAVSTLASVLTVFMLTLFLYTEWGTVAGLVAVLLLSTNYFFIGINRSALPESTMVFFLLASFIACYKTMKADRHYGAWGIGTGILAMLSFFTKQSGAAIFGVILIGWIADAYITKDRSKYTKVAIGFGATIIVVLLCYMIAVYLPNKDIWYANYKATVGGNRPRKMLIIPSYTIQQIKNTFSSPFWSYVPILLLATLASIFKRRSRLSHLALLWFLLFVFHVYTMPDKYARFLVAGIMPMTILAASFFRSLKIRSYVAVITLFLLIEVSLNIYWDYKYVVMSPTYTYLNSARSLYKIVGKTKGIYPVHWIINAPFNSMSTYVMPVSDRSFMRFFKQYGTPTYVSLVKLQIEDYKTRAPLFLSRLRYIKTISNYDIFIYRP